MLLGQQHGVSGEHAPPFRKGLGEGDHGLSVVDAAGHLLYAVGAVGAGDGEGLVLAAGRVDLRRDVLPGDGGAVAPDRFRVDGVGDDLWVFAGQLDVGEVVGVDRRRSVRSDPERARHRRPQHGSGVGHVPVDVQRVEVRRVLGQRQPQVAALVQRGGILRIDVAGIADLGVTPGRRSFLFAARATGDGESRRPAAAAAKRRIIIRPTLAAVRARLRHCGQQLAGCIHGAGWRTPGRRRPARRSCR